MTTLQHMLAQAGTGARLLLLGAAQDGGVPQTGCACANCAAVKRGELPQQYAVSAALLDDTTHSCWLLDCGPDFKQQHDLLQQHAPGYQIQGVLLTHLHFGHYVGLYQFGREVMDRKGLQVFGTPSVCTFFRRNQPWQQFLAAGNLMLHEVAPGRPFELGGATNSAGATAAAPAMDPDVDSGAMECSSGGMGAGGRSCDGAPEAVTRSTGTSNIDSSKKGSGIVVTAVPVPHRAEYSDTVAWHVQGPGGRSAFYCPDIDSWAQWNEQQGGTSRVRDMVKSVDVAFLDATFYSADKLPGRDISQVPHPLVVDTLQLLQGLGSRVVLVHMNHSNPILRAGPQRYACVQQGFAVGQQGAVYAL